MRSRWTALFAVLVFAGLTPRSSEAQRSPQTVPPTKAPVGSLHGALPNPMNPETWISFDVGDYPACSVPGHLYTVSLTIYNLLMQPYAVPVLQTSGSVAGGRPIVRLQLPCGAYKGYWNGKILNTQREAASGLYVFHLGIDGQIFSGKMNVVK